VQNKVELVFFPGTFHGLYTKETEFLTGSQEPSHEEMVNPVCSGHTDNRFLVSFFISENLD